MNPRWLFPLLSLLFAALALWHGRPGSALRRGARTWGWLALAFGAVSLWLHFGPGHPA